ncbi:hypothetical protein SNE40_003924 [Patella caerulea]|uniref:Uncharacterized protein n=1 Tax=Patella caerulea TaxID=87958 RepID=A0AAN8KAU0_PATCE
MVLGFDAVRSSGCREPDLSKLRLGADDIHESFYQLPSMSSHMVNKTMSEYVNIHHGYIPGPKRCPSWNEIASNYDGRLCPVYYVLNHDENRIPKSFVEARCSCRNPPTEVNLGSTYSVYDCAPLMKYSKVQRRIGCDGNGVYIYQPMWESVQMGCFTKLSVRSGSPSEPPRAPEGPK